MAGTGSSVDGGDGGSAGDEQRLPFTFRLSGGIGRLALTADRFFGWLHLDRLELEVPDLPLPFDLSSGPEKLQRRRTRVRAATLRLDGASLDALVARAAPRLAAVGIDRLRARLGAGFVTISARVRDGAVAADLTFRGHVRAAGLTVRVVAAAARVLGALPTPAPLLAHRVLVGLLGADEPRDGGAPGARVRGLGDVELDALPALLWRTFPAAGWRLPSTAEIEPAIELRDGHLALVYRPAPAADGASDRAGDGSRAAEPASADTVLRALDAMHSADELLRIGQLDDALRGYRSQLGAGGHDQPLLIERILATASARPTQYLDAVELARQVLGRWPGFGPAHAALAAVALAQGDVREAATRLHQVASAQVGDGDSDAAALAALAGARLLGALEPRASTPLYELALAHAPGDAEASDALLERFTAEARWAELARLLGRRLERATTTTRTPSDAPAHDDDRARAAREQIRLAEILGHHLGDRLGARAALERACELDPAHPAAFAALAELLRELGEPAAALAALGEVARLASERDDRRGEAAARTRMAATLLGLGDDGNAELSFHRALALDATAAEALEGAATLAAHRGDHRTAAVLLIRLLATGTPAPDEIAGHQLALGRNLLAAGDTGVARLALGRAAELGGDALAGDAHALLAEASRRDHDPRGSAAALDTAIASLGRAAEAMGAAPATRVAGDALAVRAAQLAIDRARIVAGLGDEVGAYHDYERAHRLAGERDLATSRVAARALLDAELARGDATAQARWIDAVLATRPADDERARLLVARAQLRMHQGEVPDVGPIRRDLAEAFALAEPRGARALLREAHAVEAELAAATADPRARARALAARAALIDDPGEQLGAEIDSAEAWLAAEDPGAALAAALAAGTALREPPLPSTVRRRLEVIGEAAWRQRAWPDVVRAATALLEGAAPHATLPAALPADRAATWQFRVGVASDKLGDSRAAIHAFEQVVAAGGPERTPALRQLAELFERSGDPVRAAGALEAFAADSAAVNDATRADAWYRAGEHYRKHDGRTADAERCIEAALRLVDDHLPALDALELIKREQGDDERVAVILGRKIAATGRHPSRQKPLLARLAQHQLERLGRADVARETFGRALELDPSYRPALRFVGSDAQRRGDLAEAAQALSQLASELPGDTDLPDEPAALGRERVDAALALAQIALAPSGAHWAEPARAALTRALPHAHGELAARVQGQLDALAPVPAGAPRPAQPGDHRDDRRHDERPDEASDDRVAALRRLADVARDAGDLADAAAHLDAALAVRADDPQLLRERADLAVALHDHASYAACLERLAALNATPEAAPAAELRRRTRRAEVLLELADLYYDRLRDLPRARAAMRAAAESYGTGARRDATLRMLAAEAASRRDHAEAAAAIEAIGAERFTHADRTSLAKCWQQLGRVHVGVRVLEDAQADGALSDEGALLLFALHTELKRKQELADTLERGAANARGADAVVRLNEALTIYRDALADDDGVWRVQRKLARFEGDTPEPESTGRWRKEDGEESGEADDEEPGEEDSEARGAPAEGGRRRAPSTGRWTPTPSVAGTGTGTEERVPARVTASMAVAEGDIESEADAAASDAADAADAVADAADAAAAAAHVAADAAHAVAEAAEVVHAVAEAADDADTSIIADAASATPIATVASPAARRATPHHAEIERIALAAADSGDLRGAAELLADALQTRARNLAGARAALDAATAVTIERLREQAASADHPRALAMGLAAAAEADADLAAAVRLWREVAGLWLERLGDPAAAIAALAQAEALAPDDEAVRAELDRLRGGSSSEAAAATSPAPSSDLPGGTSAGVPLDADAERLDRELRLGAEQAGRGQAEAAIAHFEAAAALAQPGDLRALAALEALYADTGDTDALTEVLGRQIVSTDDRTQKAQLWQRRARLYRDVLHREPEAYRCLKEAYAVDPDDDDIAYALRSAAMGRGEWALASELLYREIAAAPDGREAGALHLELAMIYDEKLLDAGQARVNYEQALALDPAIPAAPRPLARLYDLAGRHADAAAMNERAAGHARTAAERSHLLRRAAIQAERAGATALARRLYDLAAHAAPDAETGEAALAALARLAITDTPAPRAELLELNLGAATSPDERAEILGQLLELALQADDREVACRHATALLALVPGDTAAFRTLRGRAESSGDRTEVARLLAGRAAALTDPIERAAVAYELGRVQQIELGDEVAAAAAYQQAVTDDPEHSAALEAMADLAYGQKDWERASELYARLDARRASRTAESIALRRGEIAEALGRNDDALAAYASAAQIGTLSAPTACAALSAMMRVGVRAGKLTVAIDAARALLDHVPPDDVAATTATRLELADLSQRAGDPASAVYYYELVLSESPHSVVALRALARLYVERGNYAGAVRTLRTLVMLAPEPAARAELLHQLGELYLGRIGDADLAADSFLKAIDLDPGHVPTLRRLLDYYLRIEDFDAVLEIASELVERGALLQDATGRDLLGATMLAAACSAAMNLAGSIAQWFGAESASRLATALIETARHDNAAMFELAVESTIELMERPGSPRLDAVLAALEALSATDPRSADVARAVRTAASPGG